MIMSDPSFERFDGREHYALKLKRPRIVLIIAIISLIYKHHYYLTISVDFVLRHAYACNLKLYIIIYENMRILILRTVFEVVKEHFTVINYCSNNIDITSP